MMIREFKPTRDAAAGRFLTTRLRGTETVDKLSNRLFILWTWRPLSPFII